MKTEFRLSKVTGILSVFLFTLLFSQNVYSQCTYCSPTMSASSVDEHISRVNINTIDKKTTSSEWKQQVLDYTSISTDLKAGNTYTVKVEVGPNDYSSSDQVVLSIDFNHNCSWDTGETFSITFQSHDNSSGVGYHQTDITIPTTALGGNTRMRCSMVFGTAGPCTSASWGEHEDYTANIIIPAPDAGVAEIIPPTSPYNEGTYPVSMKLGSYGDGDIGSCTINWSVNGVAQTPYNWSGTLKKGNTVQIGLGSFAFVYPDGGPYNPFVIRVWLTNIVGIGTSNPDQDASNNDKNMNTAPSTEDAQPVAITQPSGAFVPGSVPIYVQIKNNARKPLTVVDIDWYVDGVKQGSKKWFGTLTQNQTAEVNVGSYNFYFKTPLAPFTIKAVTVNPNGVADPISSNDQVSRSVAPSLVAGTYFIGGSNAHFPTLTDAVGYLNASGILGNGDVYMKINSGTYNEQLMLNSFPHGVNKFYFESASGNAADVKLNFAPTAGNNYIFGVNGVNDVTFRNLTFNASNGGAGTAVWVSNGTNFNFSNIVFNGVQGGSSIPYSNLRLNDVALANITNCTFNYGFNGIDVSNPSGSNGIQVTNCKFLNYYNYGVNMWFWGIGGLVNGKQKDNTIQSGPRIIVTNNEFAGSTTMPQGGVYITEPANISNNKFTNFASSSNSMAAVYLYSPSASSSSQIENNNISNLTGVSGIISNTNNATINKNSVSTTGTTTIQVYGLLLNGMNNTVTYNKFLANGTTVAGHGVVAASASGMMANNLISVTNGYAFEAISNSGFEAYYNTFVTKSASQPGAYFNGGNNIFKRNLVVNLGTGRSVINTAAFVLTGENIFWTKGTTNASDLTAWVNATADATSTNTALNLADDGTYKFNQFQEPTLTYYPLGLSGTNETYDYYGNKRDGFYYAGYAGIMLDISIILQPEPLLACNGETSKQLYVAAAISYGAQAKYQWQKNGVDIPGATNPIYAIPFFNYETTGTYRCRIYGPANTATGTYSNEVLVYTLRPTEITRQPQNQQAPMGGTAFFEVEVHIKGIIAPYFQHKYQWWRHINGEEVQLMDNESYANTTSPIMTVTNLVDKHFNGEDDYYYCVIEGQCGKVTTIPVTLSLSVGEIAFDVQPTSQAICLADNLVLTANANITGGTQALTYQWFFKGKALVDDTRITGSTTTSLTVSNVGPDDEGAYYCEAYSEEFNKRGNSETANVTLNLPPAIETQPTDQTIKEGETLKLNIVASGMAPLTYQWYKDDLPINGATTANFEVVGATVAHSGFYFCKVTNDCATMKSTVVQVTVEKDGGIAGITDGNAIDLQVTPNPAIQDINISFSLENEASVEISIIDLTGKQLASKLASAVAGNNTITMTLGNNIASGSYFVQVLYNGTAFTRQIVVKK